MGNQAPLNTAFLGMGRPSFDRGALEADGVPLSVIEALMYIQATLAAMGHAGPSEGDGSRAGAGECPSRTTGCFPPR